MYNFFIHSFVIAVDYFQARYPGTTVIFDMSVVYIITAFFAVLMNNILVETLSLGTRITFGKAIFKEYRQKFILYGYLPVNLFFFLTGYLVSFLTLNFVVICEISWEVFGVATTYMINLIAVAIVSLECTGNIIDHFC